MRNHYLSPKLFVKNRKKLQGRLMPNHLVILRSNPAQRTNADGIMGFRQNSDLYYFSGIDQEETVLILFPDAVEEKYHEILFIKETNEHVRVWDGPALTKEQASERSGIETVYFSHQLWDVLPKLVFMASGFYLNLNETGFYADSLYEKDWVSKLKVGFPLHSFQRFAPIAYELRMIKEPEEIKAIEQGIVITHKMLEKAAQTLRPGIAEYQIEAAITYQLLNEGSRWHAFQPIVASGANACVLHYVVNKDECKNGDLVLIDMGAECLNYNADITRCLPVSGHFTSRQSEIYEAVLYLMKAAKEQMIPGNTFDTLNQTIGQKLDEVSVQLGVLKTVDVQNAPFDSPKPAAKKLMPHGIGHHLGLDVHDVGHKHRAFEPGMVLTNEPGIYLPSENIGIRLENDILITNQGNRDLAAALPLTRLEIEQLMQK